MKFELEDNTLSAEEFIHLKVATRFMDSRWNKWKRHLQTDYLECQQSVMVRLSEWVD